MPIPGPREDLWLSLRPKVKAKIEFVLLVFALIVVLDLMKKYCSSATAYVDHST
jgi:hypothetical protein